jgi:hypothetical protein
VSAPAPDAAGHDAASSLDDEPVGSIAEEAFKLFQAMTPPTDDVSTAAHACSTAWCPVCQVVGLVREHPEAVAAVTQAATALTRSLRDLLDQAMTHTTPQEEQ